jgi:hypothetical protein
MLFTHIFVVLLVGAVAAAPMPALSKTPSGSDSGHAANSLDDLSKFF